jgi:predicted acyl esterase
MEQPLTAAELMERLRGPDGSLSLESAERIGFVSPGPSISATDPFFSYDRPEAHGVHVEQVLVPLRDGSHLSGELHRPANADGTPAAGRFPGIVYEFNGYDAVPLFAAGVKPFVTRGYVALVCNVRGTGGSPGVIDPFGPQEQRDNVDLIEWLAEQPYSTGKIGQMGVSYGGHTTLLAAVNRPPHLTAVIAVQAISDWYENTIYRGGIPNAKIHEWQRSTAPDTLETYPRHPLYDDYWRERSVKARWDQLQVPVLDVGGWLDPYRAAMVENFRARQDSVWMVAGPWAHGMVPGRLEDIGSAAYLAWWDHWLSDLPGALPEAKVTSYEMPAEGWRLYSIWPPAESRTTSFSLSAAGELLSSTEPATPAGTSTFDVGTGQLGFETRPLDTDEVITGGIEATVRASFTAADGAIAVVLEDVAPDGTAERVANGWLRASHRRGSEELAAVAPYADYPLVIMLWPVHHRVRAGHRLKATVSSRDYPLIENDAPDGTVTVWLGEGGSTLRYQALP